MVGNAKVIYNQDEALKGADFVYGKTGRLIMIMEKCLRKTLLG